MISGQTFSQMVVTINDVEYVDCNFVDCTITGSRFFATHCKFMDCTVRCDRLASFENCELSGGYIQSDVGGITVIESVLQSMSIRCHDIVMRYVTCRADVHVTGFNTIDIFASGCERVYASGGTLSLYDSNLETLCGDVIHFSARRTSVSRIFELSRNTTDVVNCSGLLTGVESFRECFLCGEKHHRLNYDRCCDLCSMKNYTHEMTFHDNAQSDGLPSFGVELEMCYSGPMSDSAKKLSVGLIRAGWARCSDGSVDVEFKSPIFTSLDQIKPSYELMQEASDLGFINDECGTHFHVGCSSSLIERFKYNSRYGVQVFSGLTEFMREENEHTEKTYGRGFCGFAEDVIQPSNRYSWLNVSDEHAHHTIECRLPRLNNVPSYEKLLAFWRGQIKKLNDTHNSGVWSTGELSAGLLHSYQEIFA